MVSEEGFKPFDVISVVDKSIDHKKIVVDFVSNNNIDSFWHQLQLKILRKSHVQHTKKVVSNSPGLVDFAIGPVNSVLNLPDGQVEYFEEFNLQKNCEINSAHQKLLGAS